MGYFGSRAFLISSLIGLVLASTTALGPVLFPEFIGSFSNESCDAPDAFDVAPGVSRTSATERTLDFRTQPGEGLHICIVAGSVVIRPHEKETIDIQVSIRSPGSGLHDLEDRTNVVLRRDGTQLMLAETAHGRSSHWINSDEAQVYVVVLVPAGVAQSYDVSLGQGTLMATGLAGAGSQSWSLGVGDAEVRFGTLQSSQIEAHVQVGNLLVALPKGPAYTIEAKVQVGGIEVAIPGFDLDDRNTDMPGEYVRGHTDGGVPVDLIARVQVGDIQLWSM